jgi:hypothetical protein
MYCCFHWRLQATFTSWWTPPDLLICCIYSEC